MQCRFKGSSPFVQRLFEGVLGRVLPSSIVKICRWPSRQEETRDTHDSGFRLATPLVRSIQTYLEGPPDEQDSPFSAWRDLPNRGSLCLVWAEHPSEHPVASYPKFAKILHFWVS